MQRSGELFGLGDKREGSFRILSGDGVCLFVLFYFASLG